jgi:aspartate racemase
MSERIIGILGGMGPEATIDLFMKIVRATKARRDQDHLRILIDNNPKVPDRTAALRGKGPSPVSELVRSARGLQKAGADFIVIPCVTAHCFIEPLQKKIRIPIVHIVDETVRHVRRRMKTVRKVGLIATSGTVESGLFQKAFEETPVALVCPSPEVQRKNVMEAIYGKKGVKAVGPSEASKALVVEAARTLIDQGCQAVIAGCTEIPLVLKDGDLSVPVIDPPSILARAAIARARGR